MFQAVASLQSIFSPRVFLICNTIYLVLCFKTDIILILLYVFQFCNTKLMALNLMTELSKYVTADIILDRILPYMVRNQSGVLA